MFLRCANLWLAFNPLGPNKLGRSTKTMCNGDESSEECALALPTDCVCSFLEDNFAFICGYNFKPVQVVLSGTVDCEDLCLHISFRKWLCLGPLLLSAFTIGIKDHSACSWPCFLPFVRFRRRFRASCVSRYGLLPHTFVVIFIQPPHVAASHPAHEHSLAPVSHANDVAKARKVPF